MPLLDVTEILSDDDLGDVFDVIRRVEVPDGHGRATYTPTTIPNQVGVVISIDPSDLKRDDGSELSFRNISIATTFRLRAAGIGIQADQVVWDGITFTITKVKVHTRWGAGFVKAEATSQNAYDAPPT